MSFRSKDLTVKLFPATPDESCGGNPSCCGCSDTQDDECRPSCKQTPRPHGNEEKLHALGALRQQLRAALAVSA